MERMSLLDAEFWYAEDAVSHLHIGGISVFAGPAPTPDERSALVASKLALIPRYRQRVREVPFGLGRPVWVDDADFDLTFHVRHSALPSPGGDAELCTLMGRIMSQPLDRTRPLWEAWFVDGLADGAWALISKVHHCMVDGIAGVGLLNVLLDLTPDAATLPAADWVPEPAPGVPALVLDAWNGLAADVSGRLARIPSELRDPAGTLRRASDTLQGWARFARRLAATEPVSIDGTIGPHRIWAHAEADLADVKAIRQAFGGTVNDVVLAALAGGYRALLAARGDNPDSAVVRTLVPVSVRSADASGRADNQVSALLVELPVHLADPCARLDWVRAAMPALKASHMAEAGAVMTRLGDLVPPFVIGPVTRLVSRTLTRTSQQSINTVTTNVPGPQFPLWCLGREMTAYLPFVPVGPGARVGTAILSYNGQISFGVTGDRDTAADVAVLTDATVADLAVLLARATETTKSTAVAVPADGVPAQPAAGPADPAGTPAATPVPAARGIRGLPATNR